ncbi:MAG: hypothetical protein Ta2E_00320 [Mycoplasmoidaceae bacterium]|nr:MAG: hypothetical protein Ta2E_00320 [Mycoplasmoidaceae bacterium]
MWIIIDEDYKRILEKFCLALECCINLENISEIKLMKEYWKTMDLNSEYITMARKIGFMEAKIVGIVGNICFLGNTKKVKSIRLRAKGYTEFDWTARAREELRDWWNEVEYKSFLTSIPES